MPGVTKHSRRFSVDVDGEEAQIRVLGATLKRCAFAFVSGPGAEALLKKLNQDGRPDAVEEQVGGLFLPPLPKLDHSPDFPGRPPLYREQIGLVEPFVVVPELPASPNSEERIIWGSSVYHEFRHSRGGGEYHSYHDEDRYRERNGLPPQFKDDQELFAFLNAHPFYGPEEEWEARMDELSEFAEKEKNSR